jgi:predicted nucleic acid-binding protein
MNILVDSSIWIDYFRSGKNSELLDDYIDQNLICTNYLILSEIIPSLKIKKKSKVIKLLYNINRIALNPDWNKIIDLQTKCLKNGINKVGIPDLIILDNVLQNDLTLYTLDNHFFLIQKVVQFNIIK